MTADEKLDMLKALLVWDSAEDDSVLSAYLNLAGKEILAWKYSYVDEKPEDVPEDLEMIQIFAVVNGYSQLGAEGEVVHIESSVHRNFKYADMISYIHAHVIPYAGVV